MRATMGVWDAGCRMFHWLLVISVTVALATGLSGDKRLVDIHVIAGTLIAVLLTFRLVWGATGSTYARFSSFAFNPLIVLKHVLELLRDPAKSHHYVGHNPLGAAMIFALLAALVVLTATGIVVFGGALKDGPLAPFTTFSAGSSASEIHEFAAYGLLVLVALHVAGVAIESLRTKENLVRAMITGRKPIDPHAIAAAPRRARSGTAMLVVTGIAVPTAVAAYHYAQMPGLGVPTAPVSAAYAKECKACHSLHHPSIAPAATWADIMAGLEDHFGENASLDGNLRSELQTYLTANSAEHWDTEAANLLRTPAVREPLRITSTQGWKRLHRDVPADVFKRKSVGGALNCSQCHADAEKGRFAPRAIAIPEEKTGP